MGTSVDIDFTTPEGARRVKDYVRTLRLRVMDLEQKDATQLRIIQNRDDEIARLEKENATLAAELKKKPKRPRAVDEMCDELVDWYGLAHLIILRLQAIGEKYGEPVGPVESFDP